MAGFSIVPVLDLKDGSVVHARAGERAAYRPIRSPLAAGSDALAVAEGLLSLAPFRALYVADLDAIEGRGSHEAVIERLARRHPEIELWVDSGIASAAAAEAAARRGAVPVLGSESLADADVVAAVIARLGPRGSVLSLDYRGDRFLGPPALEAEATLWPDRVIVMTLSRVGTGAGPDLDRLALLRARARGRSIFAAGGVRDESDIGRLAAAGVAGALVATALHDGRLGRAELAAIAAER